MSEEATPIPNVPVPVSQCPPLPMICMFLDFGTNPFWV
jgi:hypothetical protein